jgi:hypothetical protein
MQIIPIKDTYAYILCSISEIQPGDPITVSYTNKGYYNLSGPCLCSICQPSNPPEPPKRQPQLTNIPPPNPGKKTRRGGHRNKVRRTNQAKRLAEQEGNHEQKLQELELIAHNDSD